MLHYQMSRVTRKPDFCLCENKGADQLRSNCEADHRLCFRYTDITLSLLIKSEISSFYAASGTGHVGMLPPFYRTFTQNEDVITSNKCLKYNYPTKTQKAYWKRSLRTFSTVFTLNMKKIVPMIDCSLSITRLSHKALNKN